MIDLVDLVDLISANNHHEWTVTKADESTWTVHWSSNRLPRADNSSFNKMISFFVLFLKSFSSFLPNPNMAKLTARQSTTELLILTERIICGEEQHFSFSFTFFRFYMTTMKYRSTVSHLGMWRWSSFWKQGFFVTWTKCTSYLFGFRVNV